MRYLSMFPTFSRFVTAALAMGFMVVFATSALAVPPSPAAIVKTQKGQLEKAKKEKELLEAELNGLKEKCGSAATSPATGKDCQQGMDQLAALAIAVARRVPRTDLKPVLVKLDEIAKAIVERSGDTACQLLANSGKDEHGALVAPKLGDACLRDTADKTVLAQEWIRANAQKAPSSRLYIGRNAMIVESVFAPTAPAPYGAYSSDKEIDAKKETDLARVKSGTTVELKRLELEATKTTQTHWAVKWIALPLGTGLLTGGLCAAFWPNVDSDGEEQRGNSFGKCMAAGTGLGLIAGGAWEAAD